MASILNQAKRKAMNPDDDDHRRIRLRQELRGANGSHLRKAGKRNLSTLPNEDSTDPTPPPLNILRRDKALCPDLCFQSKTPASHPDQGKSPISPVSDITMNDQDVNFATSTQRSEMPLGADRDQIYSKPTGFSTVEYHSSAPPTNHTYHFGDKVAEVTYDGQNFKLEIGSHQNLKRSGIHHSSTATQHVYRIQDMNIEVESDGHQLTMTTSANQETVVNADTESSGSASQFLRSTINQNGQQERSLSCYGSIFEIRGHLEFESVYCYLTIVDRPEFLKHIAKEVKSGHEQYIHLDLDRTPGVRYAQPISNFFHFIRDCKGVELDAVLDRRIIKTNQHTMPIMLNVYGPETEGHGIREFFKRHNTILYKPIHVPIKFGHGVPCSDDRGQLFFYCRQLYLLAVLNYESITKQSEWKYKWNQATWQKKGWDDLGAKVKELTKGAVQFPPVIDATENWGLSLLKI